jgi:methyltransferase
LGTEVAAAVVVFAFMAVEARRAARNERAQRALGGIEPPDDVYRWMQVAYPGAFAAMFAETAMRHAPTPSLAIAGGIVFTLAKVVKWWAILTLGRFWTFRVIVVPGATLVSRGPYRFLRHPNYVGVIGELVGVGLLTGAVVAGPVATILFAMLIRRRVAVEERALRGLPSESFSSRRDSSRVRPSV